MCELVAALGSARARASAARARTRKPAPPWIGGSPAAPGQAPLGRIWSGVFEFWVRHATPLRIWGAPKTRAKEPPVAVPRAASTRPLPRPCGATLRGLWGCARVFACIVRFVFACLPACASSPPLSLPHLSCLVCHMHHGYRSKMGSPPGVFAATAFVAARQVPPVSLCACQLDGLLCTAQRLAPPPATLARGGFPSPSFSGGFFASRLQPRQRLCRPGGEARAPRGARPLPSGQTRRPPSCIGPFAGAVRRGISSVLCCAWVCLWCLPLRALRRGWC